jgi:hypothetical protein
MKAFLTRLSQRTALQRTAVDADAPVRVPFLGVNGETARVCAESRHPNLSPGKMGQGKGQEDITYGNAS